MYQTDLVKTTNATISGDFYDVPKVWTAFLYHLSSMPGLTVLSSIMHQFPGGGFTGIVLLGESHAAIHTWPELGKAWIELATCGDPAALDMFAKWELIP